MAKNVSTVQFYTYYISQEASKIRSVRVTDEKTEAWRNELTWLERKNQDSH